MPPFLAMFSKEDNRCDFFGASMDNKLLPEWGSAVKGKNLLMWINY